MKGRRPKLADQQNDATQRRITLGSGSTGGSTGGAR